MGKNKTQYANVGGQAVMEGIMMRSPKKTVMAVRTPDQSIVTEEVKFTSIRKKIKFFALPIIRGAVAFIESLILGFQTLTRSAELSGLDEETNGNKFLESLMLIVSFVLGIGIAVGVFILLPVGIRMGLSWLIDGTTNCFGYFRSIIEGVVRIGIFVLYVFAVSRMKEIRRLFQYHGAEHKAIFCFEAGKELTVENVRVQSRLHPRCGTSFLLITMLVSILVYSMIPFDGALYVLIKFALLPIIGGISFELIQLADRYNNVCTRILSAPGKLMQMITTCDPDDDQIEVAIAALTASLTDDGETLDHEAAYKSEEDVK